MVGGSFPFSALIFIKNLKKLSKTYFYCLGKAKKFLKKSERKSLQFRRSIFSSKQIKINEEVVTPAVTWSTTVFPIVNVKAKPVFVDVESETFNIDPQKIEKAITKKTRAIMTVHLLGNPCNMKIIKKIARKHDLFLIEDCCEALGAKFEGKKVGVFGDLATFSFFASHHITTMEGGMLVTNNQKLFEIAKSLRTHGWSRGLKNKKTLEKKYSKIDVLINNAAYQGNNKIRKTSFEELSLRDWNKAISVNLTGIFLICQQVGKIMKKQGTGNIINIGSTYGLVAPDQRIYGNSGQNAGSFYSATKSAVIGLTRYLASYWANTGIRVNTLSLGGVKRNQVKSFIKNYSKKTMLGRMAEQDEYVGAIIFLASDASSYMTGSNLIIDGGWTAW